MTDGTVEKSLIQQRLEELPDDDAYDRLRAVLSGELPEDEEGVELTHAERYYFFGEGQQFLMARELEAARNVFFLLTVLDPLDFNFHTALGVALQELGDLEHAVRAYSAAIAINMMEITAFANRAAAFVRLGKLDAAAADLAEIERLDPDGTHPQTPHVALVRQELEAARTA